MQVGDLQKAFHRAVFEGEIDGQMPICPNGLEPEHRLHVYQNNTFGTLTSFLKAAYPKTNSLLGEDVFKVCAEQYIAHFPPKSAVLDFFAPPFAKFIDKNLGNPFLTEVARFESVLRDSMISPMPTPLGPPRLQALLKEKGHQLVLKVHPAIRLYTSAYPLHRYWQTLETSPPEGMPDIQETHFLVHLENFAAVFRTLDAGEHAFVRAIMGGKSIEKALAKALLCDGEFDLHSNLSYYLDNKILQDQ